jgi:hypothetical protein
MRRRRRLLITKREHETYSSPHLAAPRTKNAFCWGAGAGVMMLDYDPDPGADPLAPDALVAALREAVPALADSEMLWFPSASSCLYAGEHEIHGVRGQRLYLMVASARDIPRAGKALEQRLWLAGFGRIALSASGSMLLRTLVDTSVWSPERLDFAGGAQCGPGLEQRRGRPVLFPGIEQVVNTELALPDVSKKQKRAYDQEVASAKYAAGADATTIRDAWVEARIVDMVPQSKQNDETVMEAARAQLMLAAEGGVLSGDFRIHVLVRGKSETVTVKQLLENRSKYEHARCLDPIEPDYNGRAITGILYLQQARPVIFSFAHGPHTYQLGRAQRFLELEAGNTSGGVDATLSLLRESPDHYDFGDELAIVAHGQHASLNKASLAYELGSVFQYIGFNSQGEAKKVDPPRDLVAQLLSIGSWGRRLRPLKGVITAPTIRHDGSLLAEPGYDRETELYLDPNGEVMPEINPSPSLDEAQIALGVLFDPFITFPFVSPEAAGAHLAALITAVIRPTLATAPGFAYDAPVQGSGKTLLAQCVGALAAGAPPPLYPHVSGNDDAEIRKRLFAALRSSPRALIWDNVLGHLDSAAMAALLTSESLTDRILGESVTSTVPNKALLILTGNNISFAGDMPRRVLVCRIDPETDRPFSREFKLNPLEHVLANRLEMAAAACTLVRAALVSDVRGPGRLASFENWDALVRQTVIFSDRVLRPGKFGDPMSLVEEAQNNDIEQEMLYALLLALRARYLSQWFTVKSIADDTPSAHTPIGRALMDIGGEHALKSTSGIGRLLKYRTGRITNRLRLVSAGGSNALKYKVEEVGGEGAG